MVAGQLELLMFANIARLQADMNAMKGVVSGAMDHISRSVGAAKGVLASLGAGLSLAALAHKVDSVTESMAHLQDASEKTGASVERLSQLQFFAGVSGSNIDAVTTALAKLSKGMVSTGVEAAPTTQALKYLGLSAKDAAGNLKDPSMLFEEIAHKLIGYEDGAGKAAIAQALFGKAGAEMLPTLKTMAELGSVEASVTTEQAKAAEDYQGALARLHRQKEVVWNQIVGAMLPSMQSLVDALLEASKKTDSLNSAAKHLAEDGSITDWADKGAKAVAILIDAIKFIPNLLSAVSSSFQVVSADINLIAKAGVLANPAAIAAAAAAGRNVFKEFQDALTERNEKLATADAKYAALLTGEVNTMQKAVAAQIDARKALNKFVAGIGVDAMLDDAMFGGGEKLKKLNFSPVDAKLAAAELKLYEGAIKKLAEELGQLSNWTERDRLNFEMFGQSLKMADGSVVHLTGNLEKLTPAHKKMVNALAAQVDARKQLLEASKLTIEYIETLNKARDAEQSIIRSTLQSDKDYVDDLKFQASLINKTAREQERMNEVRKIDLKLRADIRAAADAAGEDTGLFYSTMTQLEAQAEQQKKAVLEGVAVRVQAERDWLTGANSAFNDYIDHATNAAQQTRDLFNHAFQSMEDALVEFAKTGKLDFKKLADSIISDIIRIQVRMAIAKTMESVGGAGGIFGFLGKLFGGGGGGPSAMGYGESGTAAASAMVSDGVGGFVAAIGRGAAFDGSGRLAFAHGGVVGSPTRFHFADGGAMRQGIMGEAGPEAILPLKRVNGQLGVATDGGGGPVTFEVNIDARGADMSIMPRVDQALKQFKREVVPMVVDAKRRGGAARSTLRR